MPAAAGSGLSESAVVLLQVGRCEGGATCGASKLLAASLPHEILVPGSECEQAVFSPHLLLKSLWPPATPDEDGVLPAAMPLVLVLPLGLAALFPALLLAPAPPPWLALY